MIIVMNCKADIAAQDADYPTYKSIDCDLHTNANNDNFYGRLIDCDLAITTTLTTACKSWNQGIRTTITIDDVDVTASLIGAINISRRKNQIATFSFTLGDSIYSPLTNSHIVPNKVVVITSYINAFEAKLFTGLIDDASASWDGNFSVTISGSGYGKKLRDTRKTLVNIQDHSFGHFRQNLVRYLVIQAGITWVASSMPIGSYTKIDHSFEDQTILDMITKELVIDGMRWEFDEEGHFQASYDRIKSNTIAIERSPSLWSYIAWSSPDWSYNEDRFFYLGLRTSDDNIINDVKILGTIYETQIEVENPEDSPSGEWVDPDADDNLFSIERTLSTGESILDWGSSGYIDPSWPFNLTVHNGIRNVLGVFTQPHFWYGEKYYYYTIDVRWEGKLRLDDYNMNCEEGFEFYTKSKFTAPPGTRFVTRRYLDDILQGKEGTVRISLNGKWIEYQDTPEEDSPVSAIVDNEDVDTPTYDYKYDQVAVHVENEYSINKYGRRKPNSQGVIEFPLAENTNQCKGIGRKIIKDSHKNTKQPSFEVPFNPLLKVGQTVSINDKKIGYSQRWYVEEVNHVIEQGKGRTRIGCVYYA